VFEKLLFKQIIKVKCQNHIEHQWDIGKRLVYQWFSGNLLFLQNIFY